MPATHSAASSRELSQSSGEPLSTTPRDRTSTHSKAMIVSFRGFKTNQRFHNQTHACKISQKNLYIACIMSG